MNVGRGRPPQASGAGCHASARGGRMRWSCVSMRLRVARRASRPALTTPRTRVVNKNCAQWRLKKTAPRAAPERGTDHERDHHSNRETLKRGPTNADERHNTNSIAWPGDQNLRAAGFTPRLRPPVQYAQDRPSCEPRSLRAQKVAAGCTPNPVLAPPRHLIAGSCAFLHPAKACRPSPLGPPQRPTSAGTSPRENPDNPQRSPETALPEPRARPSALSSPSRPPSA